ncbi:MAG: hypothetical protein ACOYIP_05465 [Coriobacteriales bacterium]
MPRETAAVPSAPTPVPVSRAPIYEGVATLLCEHRMRVYFDFSDDLQQGETLALLLDDGTYRMEMTGVVAELVTSRSGAATVHIIDIVDYDSSELEYLQLLYDRIPSLPQALTNDFGLVGFLWRNIKMRVARDGQAA